MIAPETLAAVLRVAQHGVHRAMLTARGDDAVDHPQGTDNLLHAAAARNLPRTRASQEPRMPARLSMPSACRTAALLWQDSGGAAGPQARATRLAGSSRVPVCGNRHWPGHARHLTTSANLGRSPGS